ncbi:hypothetical protein ACHWQZ_G002974 [Mnemiopsis leidyi]
MLRQCSKLKLTTNSVFITYSSLTYNVGKSHSRVICLRLSFYRPLHNVRRKQIPSSCENLTLNLCQLPSALINFELVIDNCLKFLYPENACRLITTRKKRLPTINGMKE